MRTFGAMLSRPRSSVRRPRWELAAVGVALTLLAGCTGEDFGSSAQTGSLAIHVIWPDTATSANVTPSQVTPQTAPSLVVTMDATITAGGQTFTHSAPASAGSDSISGIPVGPATLTVDALDANNQMLYTGNNNNITVVGGTTTPATVTMGAAGYAVPPWGSTVSGAMDPSFHGGSPIVFNNPLSNNSNADSAVGVVVDSQDRVVVLDYAVGTVIHQFLIGRWTAAGVADSMFGKYSPNLTISPDCTGTINVSSCFNQISTLDGDNAAALALDQSQNGTGVSAEYDRPVVLGNDGAGAYASTWRFHHATNDGEKDTNFATGSGFVNTVNPVVVSGSESMTSTAVDSQGRILTAGYVKDGSGNQVVFVSRTLSTGGSDSSFGPGGPGAGWALQTNTGVSATSVSTTIGGGAYSAGFDSVAAVLVDKSPCGTRPTATCERYVLVGTTTTSGGNVAIWVSRLTNSGSTDTTFGTSSAYNYSTLFNSLGGFNQYAVGGAVDALGRVLVTGYAYAPGNIQHAATWRFAADKTGLDGTFGPGYVAASQTSVVAYSEGISVLVEPTGSNRVIMAGFASDPSNVALTKVQVWRYSSTGVLDTTFNGGVGGLDHVVLPNASGGTADFLVSGLSGNGLASDSQGRYVLAGTTSGATCSPTCPTSVAIWRLLP